ncbi:MAG: SLC13 family permease [Gammaproteobacteria bacterium]|nr:SLC13 family permease [Gammaproteobacteria bacterium]
MTGEILSIFVLLAVTVSLFIWDRIRMDIVALMVALTLALSGLITPAEVFSGFGAPVVVMIAGLFIVGEGLFRTGIAAAAGQWLLRVGGENEVRLLLFLIPLIAILSAFMSSTGAVALLIPVVLSMSRKSGMSPSKLLMPLAFASLVGGMLTLIGTPPNIVVSSQMETAGFEPFNFFDFTPVGLVVLMVAIVYLILIGRRLLPNRGIRNPDHPHPHFHEFSERYGIKDHLHLLSVTEGSSLIGQTVSTAGLRTHFEVTVFSIKRRGRLTSALLPVTIITKIKKRDVLMVFATAENITQLCEKHKCKSRKIPKGTITKMHNEFGVAEVMLRRTSSLMNKTIKEGKFREKFGLSVIGLRRDEIPMMTDFDGTPLKFADSLLLIGGWQFIEQLLEKRDFVVLETPAEMVEAPSHGSKAPHAILIMLMMLVTMSTGILPSLTAVLAAALAMIIAGCVTMEEAYKSLNGPSLILIACMLPLAIAMEKTGAAALIVDQLINSFGGSGPMALGAALFIFTSVFSQFMSNTATTVLVAPIALTASQSMGLNPEPYMMMVALAASTAFATPIASPVNTLILTPGKYSFMDFVKVGVPLQLMAMLIALLLIPIVFPF